MTTVVPLRVTFDLSDVSTLKLDLANPQPKDLAALIQLLETDMKLKPDLGVLPVRTGWNEITPTIALNLLRRNRPGANRKIDSGTVFYYANQMIRNQWKATGQPILISAEGILLDAQHRLLAILIAGAIIKSFVVTEIEPIPNLFAYIDNTRPRTAATALQTAGHNGSSSSIVRIIRIGEEVRCGLYNPTGPSKLPRLSPVDILDLIPTYPNARQAARSAASDWDEAVTYIGGRRDVIGYFGMRIIDLHGEEVADDFFEEVMDDVTERPADHPIAALRKVVDKDNRLERRMPKHHMLAALIMAFNAWYCQEPLGRRWMLQVDENFPVFVKPEADEAEAA